MSIICDACGGDGLNHPNYDVFEIVQDAPCGDCGGCGTNEDGGDPVDIKAKLKGRYDYIEYDLEFYMGEGVDDDEELPVVAFYSAHPAEYGAREPGTGLQLEPDYPAGVEIEDCYVQVNNEWWYFEPSDDQESTLLKYLNSDRGE